MEQNEYTVGQENFNLPHDVLPLPTKGIFYKSKKKTVKVGYLTAQDENIILNVTDNMVEGIITNLIRNKLYEHDLRPDDLIDSDVEAILLFLRNTSFGPEYNVSVTDPKTGKQFSTTLILDELNITKPVYTPNEEGLFETKLPKSGAQVKLRPITLGENKEIDMMAERYPVGVVPPKITWRLNKQIQEVNGSRDREHIARFIDSLPIMDSKYIRNFLRENVPSLDLKKTVKAPSGELVTVDITFGVEFFRPFF